MPHGSDRHGAVRVHLGAGANEEGDVVGQAMLRLPKSSQPGGQPRHLPVELGELVGVLRHCVRRWAIGGRLLVEVESPLVGGVVELLGSCEASGLAPEVLPCRAQAAPLARR